MIPAIAPFFGLANLRLCLRLPLKGHLLSFHLYHASQLFPLSHAHDLFHGQPGLSYSLWYLDWSQVALVSFPASSYFCYLVVCHDFVSLWEAGFGMGYSTTKKNPNVLDNERFVLMCCYTVLISNNVCVNWTLCLSAFMTKGSSTYYVMLIIQDVKGLNLIYFDGNIHPSQK